MKPFRHPANWCVVLLVAALGASCAPKPPPTQSGGGDPDEVLALSAAAIAFNRGDVPGAQTLYRRALERARAINSPELIADAAYDLAVCEVDLDHFDMAVTLLQEAEYDASRSRADVLDIILLRAKVAYFQGNFAEANDLSAKVVKSSDTGARRLQAMVLQGRIFCDQGNLSAARIQARDVARMLADGDLPASPSVRADIANLRGAIAVREKNYLSAAGSFDAEAEFLRKASRYRDMTHALARAAEAYLSGDKPAAAADRFFLAARSSAAQGDIQRARPLLASSISAAEKAGNSSTRDLAAALLKSISAPDVP